MLPGKAIVTVPAYVPAANPTMSVPTPMLLLPAPDAGDAPSQGPPLVVVTETVQTVAEEPTGIVSCTCCALGLTPPVAVKVSWDGVTVGTELLTVKVTATWTGETVVPGNVTETTPA